MHVKSSTDGSMLGLVISLSTKSLNWICSKKDFLWSYSSNHPRKFNHKNATLDQYSRSNGQKINTRRINSSRFRSSNQMIWRLLSLMDWKWLIWVTTVQNGRRKWINKPNGKIRINSLKNSPNTCQKAKSRRAVITPNYSSTLLLKLMIRL